MSKSSKSAEPSAGARLLRRALAALGALALVGLMGCDTKALSGGGSGGSGGGVVAPVQQAAGLGGGAPQLSIAERIARFQNGPTADPHASAYAQQVETAITVELLKQLGQAITNADIEAEVEHIARDTRDPARLKELQAICGGENTTAYRDLVVLPIVANRKYFYSVYPQSTEIHKARFDEANAALQALLAQGARADYAAVASGDPRWRVETVTHSATVGFVRPGMERVSPPPGRVPAAKASQSQSARFNAEGSEYERAIFSQLAAGETYSKLVETDDGFHILRWIGWVDGTGDRRVEHLWLPKRDAHDFLMDRARRMDIRLPDAETVRSVQVNATWAQHLHIGVGPTEMASASTIRVNGAGR